MADISTIVGAAERIYPVYKLIPLTTYLASAGIAVAQSLAGSGLVAADLTDPYCCISRQQVTVVFQNFLRLSPGRLSALELGASFHLTDYGYYGYALLSSPTVRDAVNFGMAYRELATPIVDVELLEAKDEATWLIQPLADYVADPALAHFVQEYQCGILLSLHHSVSGSAFRLRSASFAYPAPAASASAHYQRVFNCPITFDAPHTCMRFERDWLEQRPLGAHAVTFQLVQDTCREMLERIDSGRGVVGEVYRHLLSRSGQFASLEQMAGYLGQHPRTLRRKLVSEGMTYQKIVDDVRFKLASSYLTRTQMTHESISERLGFSDASAFRRAFKRWAGVAPNTFKQG